MRSVTHNLRAIEESRRGQFSRDLCTQKKASSIALSAIPIEWMAPRRPLESPNDTITPFNYLRQYRSSRSTHFLVNFLIRSSNRCGFRSGGVRSRRNNKDFSNGTDWPFCQRAASLKIQGFWRCLKPWLIPPALYPEFYERPHKNNVDFQLPWRAPVFSGGSSMIVRVLYLCSPTMEIASCLGASIFKTVLPLNPLGEMLY